MLTFDEATHKYFWEGKEVPGVSHILKTVGLTKDFSGISPFYAERGKAVHKAIQLYLLDDLDEVSLDAQIMPYFAGFLRYWEQHKDELNAMEKPFYDPYSASAGTVDLLTPVRVIDWKCSKSHDKVAEIQGAAYKIMTGASFFRVVQLPGDGTFEIFDYEASPKLWEHTMALYRWKKGIK